MPKKVVERAAKALAVALHAVRPGADPELVWAVLTDQQRTLYRTAAAAVVLEYLAAVSEPPEAGPAAPEPDAP